MAWTKINKAAVGNWTKVPKPTTSDFTINPGNPIGLLLIWTYATSSTVNNGPWVRVPKATNSNWTKVPKAT